MLRTPSKTSVTPKRTESVFVPSTSSVEYAMPETATGVARVAADGMSA